MIIQLRRWIKQMSISIDRRMFRQMVGGLSDKQIGFVEDHVFNIVSCRSLASFD